MGKSKNNSYPFFTVLLVAINVLIFLYMEITGDTESTEYLYQHGAMEVEAVLKNGEWYRVITHMFIHSGIDHLVGNMLMLATVGYTLESIFGRIKFIISYFVCGLFATVFSALYDIYNNEFMVGVGASGAIMGIFCIYVMVIIKKRKAGGENNTIRLLVLVAVMVFGNMEAGVDWMAHLGGSIAGLLIGLIWYHPNKQRNSRGNPYNY